MDRWQAQAESLRKPDTLVVGLYGGPGTGKSTTAALVFGKLKAAGVNAEFVPEFAKDLVWEGRSLTLQNQIYVFAKQMHRVERLRGQVDVVVTDSPILLSNLYHDNEALKELVRQTHLSWNTLDAYLVRNDVAHPFRAEGRTQSSLAEAEVLDRRTREELFYDVANGWNTGRTQNTPYTIEFDSNENAANKIVKLVRNRLATG